MKPGLNNLIMQLLSRQLPIASVAVVQFRSLAANIDRWRILVEMGSMRLNSFLILVSTLIGLATMATSVSAATPVGTAVVVRGGATAAGPDGTRSLAKGADIFLGDKVETGVFGLVEIEFSDHTKLAVGANSSMVIDTYVMQTPAKLNSFGLTASRGAFRFLTGDSDKQAYNLKTPAATIGIRGTEFDFSVARIRPTAMALYGGIVYICSLSSGNCADLRASCDVALITDGDAVKTQTAGLTDQQIRMAFPFLYRETDLTPSMRVGSPRCGSGSHGGSTRPGENEGNHAPDGYNGNNY